jgi:hypothetical protein
VVKVVIILISSISQDHMSQNTGYFPGGSNIQHLQMSPHGTRKVYGTILIITVVEFSCADPSGCLTVCKLAPALNHLQTAILTNQIPSSYYLNLCPK